jgi:uncharacterized CHY-type Zn-finger protein
MCKHILNAQVSIRTPCCKKWYDCPECHEELESHELIKTMEMVFACKKCKKVFRKNMNDYDESDEYCPHCDNKYVVDAKMPELAVGVEADDPRMNGKFMKDDRLKQAARVYDS